MTSESSGEVEGYITHTKHMQIPKMSRHMKLHSSRYVLISAFVIEKRNEFKGAALTDDHVNGGVVEIGRQRN